MCKQKKKAKLYTYVYKRLLGIRYVYIIFKEKVIAYSYHTSILLLNFNADYII